MTTIYYLMISIVATVLIGACTLSDDERCGSEYVFEDHRCWPVDSDTGNPDTAAPPDAGNPDGDGGSLDSGQELPTGLGVPCVGPGHEDCAGFEANYCAYNPLDQNRGICTVADCSTKPDDCPGTWRCCRLISMANRPNFCMTARDYQVQREAGICLD